MKIRLKYQLILSYLVVSAVIILALMISSSLLITQQFNEYVKNNMENNMMLLATQINLELNRSPDGVDQINWERYGEVALDQGFVLNVEDANENTLWCMSCSYHEECETMLASMANTMNQVDPKFEGEYMEKHFDLIQQNQLIGTMVLGHYGPYHYNSREVTFLTMLQQGFLLGSIAFIGFSIVLGYMMTNRIARPIDDVIEGTKRIAKGNYQETIDQKSNTIELNELITAVNQLGLTLDHQRESKRQLATDYAHEFRTPLAVLRSTLEGMMDGIWETSNQRLQSLHEEIMRLTRMIEGIDQLVEVDNKMFVLEKRIFNYKELLLSITDNFAGELHDNNIDLEIQADKLDIEADSDKLGQVIINLLSNAIKYNRPHTKLSIRLRKHRNQAILTIQDEGIGIAKEDLPFIFEHLYRADKSRRYETGGKGIGLSIVKSIVEAHQGTVSVESTLGVGSIFTVIIPVRERVL